MIPTPGQSSPPEERSVQKGGTSGAKPVVKKPSPVYEHLANMLQQYFEFIDSNSDRPAQAKKLLDMENEWAAWLQRHKLFHDPVENAPLFIDRVNYY